MTSAEYQSFHWKAHVRITDEENVVNGWTHIEASVIADDINWAQAGIEWIENSFAFGREAVIRVEETDTHYRFDTGQKEPIHKGYVRFSFRLRTANEWVRLKTESDAKIQFIGAANVRT